MLQGLDRDRYRARQRVEVHVVHDCALIGLQELALDLQSIARPLVEFGMHAPVGDLAQPAADFEVGGSRSTSSPDALKRAFNGIQKL
jgi:hypothetical protein